MPGPDRDQQHDAGWRERLSPLGGEAAVHPGSESRVVDALRISGSLKTPHRSVVIRRLTLAAAAVVLLMAGVWIGRRGSPGASQAVTGAKFALFLVEGAEFRGEREVGSDSLVREYTAWARQLAQKGQLVMGEELSDEQQTLGIAGDTRAANQISGFFIVIAADRDAALALARDCPHLKYGGGILIRPIQET